MTAAQAVDAASFKELSDFIHRKSGIQLDSSKTYLVETRLGPLLQELNVPSYRELARQASSDSRVLNRVIDEISTNETSFFRDKSPFELLKFRLIPELMDKMGSRRDSISIWSAASSTGQEVYSIAMALSEVLNPAQMSMVNIMGTDISDRAVRSASMGVYSRYEVDRGLSPELRNRHFRAEGSRWKVRDELRAMTSFRQMNLLDSFGALRPFDIIFCRNVAIYFDMPARQRLFDKLARQLKPGGALVIGSSETLHGISDRFERQEHMRCSFYVVKK